MPSNSVTVTYTAPAGPPFASSVAANHRYLLDQYGQPILVVGDSGWEMMSNISAAAADSYLQTRAGQGFNTNLFNMIASPYDNASANWASFEGVLPFAGTGPANFDVTSPNATYWAKVDAIVTSARNYGITLWSDTLGECCFQDNTGFYARVGQTNLNIFATWLANRYASFPNLVWMWGADYWLSLTAANDTYLVGMSNAARTAQPSKLHTIEGYNDGTFYPTSTANIDLTTDNANWRTTAPDSTHAQVDINNCYDSRQNSPDVPRAYALASPAPVIYGEGVYEGASKGTVGNAATQRAYAYNSILNGACGWFYGHNDVWYFKAGYTSELSTTMVAHNTIGAGFWKSYQWWTLVPDTGHTFATGGADSAGVDPAGSLGVTYRASSGATTIALSKMRGTVTARWFDPTNASYTSIGTFANTGSHVFTLPSVNSVGDPDWVLVLTA